MDEAVQPGYQTVRGDDQVTLYEGPLGVHNQQERITGDGRVFLEWHPYPRVSFKLHGGDDVEVAAGQEVGVELINLGCKATGLLRHKEVTVEVTTGVSLELEGSIADEVVVGNPAPTEAVVFHVPNFLTTLAHRSMGPLVSGPGASAPQPAHGLSIWIQCRTATVWHTTPRKVMTMGSHM